MPSLPDLEPIPQDLAPVWAGEKVAFTEDHPTYPGMYAYVNSFGVEGGILKYDVSVMDPFTGELTSDQARITSEEIQ